MNDSRFNKGIEEIKTLGMTASEKSALFERVMAATKNSEPVKSPWTVYSFSSWVMRNRTLSASLAAILIVVLAGGSVASASMKALPGDALYGVKIHVVEPLRVALAPTPEAKAKVEVELANTRVEEAQTLAAQGKLDQKTEDEITERISVHAEALGKDREASALAQVHALLHASATSTIETEDKKQDKPHGESNHSNKIEVHSNIPFIQNNDGSIDASTSNSNGSSNVHIEINQGNSSSHASVHIDQHVNEASVIQAIPVEVNLGHGQGRGKDK